MKFNIFEQEVITPLKSFGLTSKFWGINIETLIYTWIAMFILFTLILIARLFLKKDLNPVAILFTKSVDFFDNLCRESFEGQFKYEYFSFSSSIFFFTLFCCLVGLLPYVEESTKDLNTTLAVGSLSFFYVQYQKIKVHGIWAYMKEFAEPFILLLPLNIIGELAKIASMSFRLFGNILGGAIIFLIAVNALAAYKAYFILFALGTLFSYVFLKKFIDFEKHKILKIMYNILLLATFFLSGAQMFFGVFEGFVQSFVITMLTITYLSVAVSPMEDHDHEDAGKKNNKLDEIKLEKETKEKTDQSEEYLLC